MKRAPIHTLLAVFAAAALLAGCGGPSPAPVREVDTLDLKPYRGRPVVMLFGCVGCEGTHQAWRRLQDDHRRFGDRVTFLRVDHRQDLEATADHYRRYPPPFPVLADPGGHIGPTLPEQALPTVYLYGKWGSVRYHGSYERARLTERLPLLLAETDPAKGHKFLKPPEVTEGDPLVDFTLPTLDGPALTLAQHRKKAKATVLLFTGTSCPYSTQACKSLVHLYDDLETPDLAALVVNCGEPLAKVKGAFADLDPDFPIAWAEDEKLARRYGISSVPTFLVADAGGKVVLRCLHVPAAVEQEVLILLGKLKPEQRRAIDTSGPG